MTKKIMKVLSLVLALVMLGSVAILPVSAVSVSQVKNLKVVETDEDEIEVRWSKIKGVNGYQVYIKAENGSWKKVLTTKDNEADIEKLSSAKTYTVKVRAYKKSGSKNYYGKFSSSVVTSTEPDEVKNLSIKSSSKNATLTWSKVSGADGYRVYKYNTKTKKWEKVANVKANSATVSVSSKGGEKFKVKAYTYLNGKYYYSDSSAVVINGLDAIGYEKAKSIALENAKVKSSNVREYEAQLKKVKGVYVYEIEFEAGKYEYEYIINAESGKIIRKDKERS